MRPPVKQDQPLSPPAPETGRGRRWIARLAFSFCILALVAAYEGWKAYGAGDEVRAALLLAGAVAGASLGALGLRMRHRPE